jgi:hypothetical protein
MVIAISLELVIAIAGIRNQSRDRNSRLFCAHIVETMGKCA